MKRFLVIFVFCFFAIFFVSCNLFTTPLFTSSVDFSTTVAEKSTEDIATNIDKYSSNPEDIAVLLDELSKRDDLQDLSLENKENILATSVAAVLPMQEVIDSIQGILNSEGNDNNEETEDSEDLDIDAMIESIIDSGTEVDMTAVQVLLQDEKVLQSGDAYTITISSIALVISVINTETKNDETISEEMINLQTMISQSLDETGVCDSAVLENTLQSSDYSQESIESVLVVMDVLSVLNGTAQDMPDRSEDTEDMSFFGLNLNDFLNDFMGVATE